MWYSMLYCPDKGEGDWGTTGFIVNGDNNEFRDFALFGWGGTRTQGGKAFCNSARKNMVIERLWIEHVCCAYWVGGGQESTNMHVKDCRIRNTGADGINLCNGSAGCLIENCHVRNTGDDGLAIWSAKDGYGQPCTNNIIRNCTVELPWRAACFAVYGGRGNRIENCVGADAYTYPGLTIGSEFNPWPMDSVTVDGLSLYRCGGHYFKGYDYEGDFGSIWMRADLPATNGITIKNVDIIDPNLAGIQLQGAGTFTNVLLDNITISNPTTFGIVINAGTSGSATFRNVQLVSNSYNVPRLVNNSSGFTLTQEGVGVTNLKTALSKAKVVLKSGIHPVLSLSLPSNGKSTLYHVNISVYLLNGKKAAVLADKDLNAGAYNFMVDREAKRAAGLYLVAVIINGNKQVFRIMLR
jgi:hypothetical protein